ncbi:MAG: STAS domain-containing protein [Magnetococcales bacterium]|nr:STAS domain-containing protein [Magnetococcales bacterium]
MYLEVKKQSNEVTIFIKNTFDFKIRTEFRNAYKDVPPNVAYVVDLRNVEALDSSGIGMLMLLWEHAGSESSNVTLVNCRPRIKHLFHAAQLDKIFHIP